MAKGNGKNGGANGSSGAAKPPAWWETAKKQLLAELEPRFQSIETKLVVLQMTADAHDTRLTRLEGKVEAIESRS